MTDGNTMSDAERIAAELRATLKSQYHAALAMFRQAVDMCPEETWRDEGPENACWQIAYHTLFFMHLYLQVDEHAFNHWTDHQPDCQYPDGIPGPPDPESPLPVGPRPYTKPQVQAYGEFCDAMIDGAVDAIDVLSPQSGFSWYKVSKLEHQLINLRHLQHGAAQIADRVRAATGRGIDWAGARR